MVIESPEAAPLQSMLPLTGALVPAAVATAPGASVVTAGAAVVAIGISVVAAGAAVVAAGAAVVAAAAGAAVVAAGAEVSAGGAEVVAAPPLQEAINMAAIKKNDNKVQERLDIFLLPYMGVFGNLPLNLSTELFSPFFDQ